MTPGGACHGDASERDWRAWLLCTLVALGATHARSAVAQEETSERLPPLTTLLDAARTHASSNREARALIAQREAESTQALYTLLPAITASAGYTRNQQQISATIPNESGGFTEAIITARNQLDATVAVEATLFDLRAIRALGVTGALEDAASADALASESRTDRSVVEAYYQRVGAEALIGAATRALETSQRHRETVASKVDAGLASELELLRADSEIERSRQSLAEAELAAMRASVALRTLTGIDARGSSPSLSEDVSQEAPLSAWLDRVDDLPQVGAADALSESADLRTSAAWSAYAPRVTAFAQERITNAASFGPNALWSAGVRAEWRLDLAQAGTARVEAAALEVARVRAERAREDARVEIENLHNEVRAKAARASAAAAERTASGRAASVARARYEAGTVLQLDLLSAERDAFEAEVNFVRAQADLAYARAALRLSAGRRNELAESSGSR